MSVGDIDDQLSLLGVPAVTATNWPELAARAAFASHRLIGWVYWDPDAVAEYCALGFGDGGPYYINSRCAPLVPAGPQVVAAACYTILPLFVELAMSLVPGPGELAEVVAIRDRAVLRGLRELAPEATAGLAALAPDLWRVVDALPVAGRAMFAAHRQQSRPADPLLSAWHAVNTLREWRGDTHFAVLAAEGIGPVEAGILHNAHLNYPPDWIPRSRGADDAALDSAYAVLDERGLAQGRSVTDAGRELRQELERRTDERCSAMWRTLGAQGTQRLIDLVEPIGDRFVQRIDETAGSEWMPAARLPRPVAD